jgi:glycolate oxidase iron-sulfur subunit
MAASDPGATVFLPIRDDRHRDAPAAADLDRCVHCGLCLNACPTYRDLGVEMDSPRGRIYQMMEVATGEQEMHPAYVRHMDLCLGCRGCESACPSGVPYGRLIEAARAEMEGGIPRPRFERLLRDFVYGRLLNSPALLEMAGSALFLYEASGLRRLLRASGLLNHLGKLGALEQLAPSAEIPFFFRNAGHIFPAEGERRYRVALMSGCIQNVFFARLNEATVRVLRKNGCEVVVPKGQGCCGALHAHAGRRDDARRLARANVDAVAPAEFDAILSNTAGCGATLKEYPDLIGQEPGYEDKARRFSERVRDVTEFLSSIEINPAMQPLNLAVTYQDACHLAHGQKVRAAPRVVLASIPGLELREMSLADMCCGSAGVYNIVHDEMAARILERKMEHVNATGATVIAAANPGCMIQMRAGVQRHGRGQRVAHVVELLDEAYRAPEAG